MKWFRSNQKMFTVLAAVCVGFVIVLSAVLVSVLCVKEKYPDDGRPSLLDNGTEIRGVWIASVYNIDFPSKPDLSADELEAEIDEIVENVLAAGLNTVFFQVRPSSDALYESSVFPVSSYLSTNGKLDFDVLEYFIKKAHEEGVAFHAWVNPLRVTAAKDIQTEDLPEGHPAREHPEWTVRYADGRLYYNCGMPEVRQLVADGVREIVEGYDVDGVVFDDYFYPYPVYEEKDGVKVASVFDDAQAFKRYGGDESADDWRRSNINEMVKLAFETVKHTDDSCTFGVAPFGIWKNGTGGEDGSLSRGSESYYSIYCDTVAWIKGGYVDYVAPQIYWRDTDTAAPFDKLCDWWQQTVEGTAVRLLISHAAYRYQNDWENPGGLMASQVEYARGKGSYRGSIFYGYEEIRDNICGVREELAGVYKNTEK